MGEYTVPEVLAVALGLWREALGLSRAEMARRCDVHVHTLEGIEYEHRKPRISTLRRIRHGLSKLAGRELTFEDISRGPITGVDYAVHNR